MTILRKWFGGAVLFSIVAPAPLRAQFEALHLVDLPPLGAWAEYQVLRRNESMRIVTSLRVSYLSRQVVSGEEYDWFQVEMESDDFGNQRLPVITQMALKHEDALGRRDFLRKLRELVVKTGPAPAFRIGPQYLALGIQKNLLSSGEQGLGSEVDYQYRELPAETVEVPAGRFASEHKKGLGRAEVVLSHEDPTRYPVDAILELWYDRGVPFGLIKQTTKQTGSGPKSESLSLTIDSEETIELVACGGGATSAIAGRPIDYSPALASRLAPRNQ